MPVTELAILPLTYSLTPSSPAIPTSLAEKLYTAKAAMKVDSGYEFLYYQQIEDPSIIYVLGRWESVAHHSTFLVSNENLGLLELLKDDIVLDGKGKGDGRVLSMWHLDADWSASAGQGRGKVFDAPVLSLERYSVSREEKDGFGRKFDRVRGVLEEVSTEFGVAGGWRIEKESEEREEWDVIVGWESVEQHLGFPNTQEGKRCREAGGFEGGIDVKHLRAVL